MIESYTNTSQTIAPEGLLSFATNDVLTGCTVLHSAGSTSFTLKRPGFYYVSFTGTGAITGATAGAITVNLLKMVQLCQEQQPLKHQLRPLIFVQ